MRPAIWGRSSYFPKCGADVAKNDKLGQKAPKKRRRESLETSQGVAGNVAGRRRKRRRRRRKRRRTSQDVAGRRRGVAATFLAKIVVFKKFWPKFGETFF